MVSWMTAINVSCSSIIILIQCESWLFSFRADEYLPSLKTSNPSIPRWLWLPTEKQLLILPTQIHPHSLSPLTSPIRITPSINAINADPLLFYNLTAMEELELCLNCQGHFPSSKFHSHHSYCIRNIRPCPQCQQMVDNNCLQEHIEDFHSKVPCQFCNQQIDLHHDNTHKSVCKFRQVECEFCEQKVPIKQFEDHQESCGARTTPCPVCEKPIIMKSLYAHAATCTGKPEVKPAESTPKSNSYQDYINKERGKIGLEPTVIKTTVTVRTQEPSGVRVLPIQKITIRPSEIKEGEPRIIRYSPTEYQTKPVTFAPDTPVESRVTYLTKQPVITRKIVSEVKYEEGVKVYGGIQSMRTMVAGESPLKSGFEDEDEELQRALLESMAMK